MVKNELYHHGVLGMKWGVRRYQNADGSLTSLGKKKYGSVTAKRDGDYIKISRDEHAMNISKNVWEEMEETYFQTAEEIIANYNNWSVKKLERHAMNDPAVRKNIYQVTDDYMSLALDELLRNYSKSESQIKNKKSSSVKDNKPKYTPEQAINKAYSDLEKKYPNFNSFAQDKQDRLWMDYVNKSGLYKYI